MTAANATTAMPNDAVKPWYASQTIWGGLAAIAAGLGGAYYGFSQHDPVMIATSLTSAGAGFHAVVGRFKADTPIGRALATADAIVEAGVAMENAANPAAAKPQS